MSRENLEAFRTTLWSEPDLLGQLRAETDRTAFISRLLALAETSGHQITADEIEAVMRENYLLWMQRWA